MSVEQNCSLSSYVCYVVQHQYLDNFELCQNDLLQSVLIEFDAHVDASQVLTHNLSGFWCDSNPTMTVSYVCMTSFNII